MKQQRGFLVTARDATQRRQRKTETHTHTHTHTHTDGLFPSTLLSSATVFHFLVLYNNQRFIVLYYIFTYTGNIGTCCIGQMRKMRDPTVGRKMATTTHPFCLEMAILILPPIPNSHKTTLCFHFTEFN